MYYSIYRTYDLSILFFSKTKQNNTPQLSNNPPSSTSHKSFFLTRSIFHALYFPLCHTFIHSCGPSLPAPQVPLYVYNRILWFVSWFTSQVSLPHWLESLNIPHAFRPLNVDRCLNIKLDLTPGARAYAFNAVWAAIRAVSTDTL